MINIKPTGVIKEIIGAVAIIFTLILIFGSYKNEWLLLSAIFFCLLFYSNLSEKDALIKVWKELSGDDIHYLCCKGEEVVTAEVELVYRDGKPCKIRKKVK